MFTTLSERINNIFFNLAIHATSSHTPGAILPKVVSLVLASPLAPLHLAAGPGSCGDEVVNTLMTGVNYVISIMVDIGIAAAVLGIIAGGLMRATSFGNERRIAMSNTAITCAVIGLVIVVLGTTVGNDLPGWFNRTSCNVAPH